jgi:two-component system, LytTR family, response regulator
MDSLLTVNVLKESKMDVFGIDLAKFPNLKHCWRAGSTREACRLIRKHKPALVILDIDMEAGLGFEVFEQTKDLEYQKIIICNTASYVIKAMRFNIDDYLVNPAGSQEIEAAIEKLLFKKKKYKIQELYSRGSKPSVTLSTVFLETNLGLKALKVDDLVRITELGHARQLHMRSQQALLTPVPLTTILDLLAGNKFAQVSAEQAINFGHVKQVIPSRGKVRLLLNDGYRMTLTLLYAERMLRKFPMNDDPSSPIFPAGGDQ